MYRQIIPCEAEGRRVRKVTISLDCNAVIVAFSDGTYILFAIRRDWVGTDDEEVYIGHELDDILDFGHNELVRAGVVTEGELEGMVQDREKARMDERREREFKVYQRLKRTYEPQAKPEQPAPEMPEGEL